MRTVRVVVADDHPLFRFGLVAALEGVVGIDVVGEAGDGAELVRLVAALAPDVALTDLTMPGTDGVGAVTEITRRFPDVAALVLTMSSADDLVLAALRAGARGYLLKDARREEIADALRVVAAGGTVLAGDVGRRIAARAADPSVGVSASTFPELTPREAEILAHVAAGRTNHQVATALRLSEKTVRNTVATILAKLGLRDRAAAVAAARDRGHVV